MSFAAFLLAPLAILLPAANAAGPAQAAVWPVPESAAEPSRLTPPPEVPAPVGLDGADSLMFQLIAQGFRADIENQVRIEQRITIRIAPRPSPVQPSMLMDLPREAPTMPRFTERNMGKCLPVSGIAGVQVTGDNRMILYMRDQRIVSAALERACSARDFYSGFYVERSADGQLCVNRDTLQARSGAQCKLSRIRQLVESGN